MATRLPLLPVLVFLGCAMAWGTELAGIVRLDDGLPPAGPIRVELICDSEPAGETVTDLHGRFTITIATGQCLVRVSLAGYLSHTLPVSELPESPDVAALVLHRDGKWKGAAISPTWMGAPDSALRAFHQAIREMRRGADGDLAAAVKSLETAVRDYPGYAAAWYELGALRLAAGDSAAAHEALAKAIEADPWFITPYEPLLIMALSEQRWQEARKLCDQLLIMNPYLANAHYYRGVASLRLGEVKEARQAVKAIEGGLEAETFAPLHHLRGLIHEQAGDLQAAASEYWKAVTADPDSDLTNQLKRLLGEWMAEGKIEQTW